MLSLLQGFSIAAARAKLSEEQVPSVEPQSRCWLGRAAVTDAKLVGASTDSPMCLCKIACRSINDELGGQVA
jgi:hypothetical protein